jgi:hypothetical protein
VLTEYFDVLYLKKAAEQTGNVYSCHHPAETNMVITTIVTEKS